MTTRSVTEKTGISRFNTYLKDIQKTGSSAGTKVTGEEMTTAIGILNTIGGALASSPAKLVALSSGFKFAKMDQAARQILYTALGIQPPNPIDPPIVALYGVRISTAISSAKKENLAELRKLSTYAKMALEEQGASTTRRARGSIEVASASSMALSSFAAEHKPNEVRAQLKLLDAKIAELELAA